VARHAPSVPVLDRCAECGWVFASELASAASWSAGYPDDNNHTASFVHGLAPLLRMYGSVPMSRYVWPRTMATSPITCLDAADASSDALSEP